MANREDYQHYSTTFGTTLTRSVTYESQKNVLNLVFQKELPSERPVIDSTKAQRLSYYRMFTSTSAKSNIIESQKVELNSFLWFYAFTLFFKTLPHGFVHFFLAVYAPEEHMFITKMVPFSFGCKYLFVLVSFLELVIWSDMMVMLLHYTFFGIINKNPWNRCPRPHYHDIFHNDTIYCYEINEFTQKIVNTSNTFHDFTFISPDNEHFILAQIDYYRLFVFGTGGIPDAIAFILIWFGIILLHYEVQKRTFWKILNYTHWVVNVIDIMIYLYLMFPFHDFDESFPIATIPVAEDSGGSHLMAADIEVFAESITAPQVVHILTSRSTQPIDPSKDSSEMILSNALIYIFRGLLNNKIRLFCESLLRTEVPVTQFNQHYWLYFWPIFFQTFYLGDLFSVIYIGFSFVAEYAALVVTLNCVMEMILYEWIKLKRWMVMLALGVAGITMFFIIDVDTRMILWIYGKGIATLADTICIYVMYPIGRLMDDFMFQYGVAPTRLRILSLKLVPVYYIFKLYMTIDSLWYVMRTTELGTLLPHYIWSWTIMLVPIILGMLYIIYLYLIKFRMTWTYIFRPMPKWGPRDFSVRQLRKQFDSRFYIASEAPKLLSRYLMSKRESKVYKIDVRYEIQRRSTVSKAVGFGKTEEKKIKLM